MMEKTKQLVLVLVILFTVSAQSFAKKYDSYNFILVHGAWHGAWNWYELEYLLLKAGSTVTSIDLPGHGSDTTNPGNVTLQDYQRAIVAVLDRFEGQSVLVGHSMGGIAISMAAEMRPSKISKLVYVAAFLLPSGQSMIQAAMSDTASLILPAIRVDTVRRVVDIDRTYIRDMFYSSSTEKYTVLSEKLLRPEPLIPLVTPVILGSNFNSVRRFYIETRYDRAITPAMQQKMYTALPCEEVYTLNSEHSPFFSTPENLKNDLLKIAKDDDATKSAVATSMTTKSNNIVSAEKPIIIYPNPTNGTINIDNVEKASNIYVYDMGGRLKTKSYYADSDKMVINLNNYPSGQYLVKIKSKGYTVSKIINYTK